jgi:hypothetical protein
MQDEIATLQAQMSTVQGKVTTLQEEVLTLQGQTEYQSVGATLYNGLHLTAIENYTNFNSAIRLTTTDLFATPPVIHTDGVIECTQIKPSVKSTLVINGSLQINGQLSVQNNVVSPYDIIGGSWQF